MLVKAVETFKYLRTVLDSQMNFSENTDDAWSSLCMEVNFQRGDKRIIFVNNNNERLFQKNESEIGL